MRRVQKYLIATITVLAMSTAVGAFAPGPMASAATSNPAFYTYQAPGGASTAGQRVIALTFDDGPSQYTAQVLAVLQRYHVPATFFEVGYEVAATPQISRMVSDAGYPVQNHTWSHANLATLPASQYQHQIGDTQHAITAATGTTPNCIRPPYDAFSPTSVDLLAGFGLTTMSYSIDSGDWRTPGVGAIVNNVVGAAFPGAVAGLHDGGGNRSQTVAALAQIITGLEARGYSFVSVCGGRSLPQASAVYGFGTAVASPAGITSTSPFTGLAAAAGKTSTPGTSSYRMTSADGGVFSFGGAASYGSLPGLGVTPARPVVGLASTADGGGYWQVASDGGVFTFGDAVFYGSMGGTVLNSPVVGITPTADGRGYWEVAADGGLFAFGDASFYGSMGGSHLNSPIVAMATTAGGGGYWMVASDGGVFSYGNARFQGSMGGTPINSPVVGLAADRATGGYWMVGADGGVFSFNAPFLGSRGHAGGSDRFFAISATDQGSGYLLAGQHDA